MPCSGDGDRYPGAGGDLRQGGGVGWAIGGGRLGRFLVAERAVAGGGLWSLRGKAPAVEGLRSLTPHEYQTLSNIAISHIPQGGVFDVITGLKDTMIDKEQCDLWINERMRWGDLFEQPGHYSPPSMQLQCVATG